MRTPFFDTENRIQSQFKPPPDLLTPYAVQLGLLPLQIYSFSRHIGSSSVYLYGAGSNEEFREYPLPFDGYLVRLRAWHTVLLSPTDDNEPFTAGDRLSCYAQKGIQFSIRARLNGSTIIATTETVNTNAYVYATIAVRFKRPVA